MHIYEVRHSRAVVHCNILIERKQLFQTNNKKAQVLVLLKSSVMEIVHRNLLVEAPTKHGQHGGGGHESKRHKTSYMEKFREVCAMLDVLAAAHSIPVHVSCIIISTAIIPIIATSIVWDLMAAIVFQIPDLSTINTPGFLLFINFVAIPLSMYGYMMEYLMHERSKLAVIGFIGVVIHPILFLVRAMIEYLFDGFRGEDKLYFETFQSEGKEAKFPIGVIRYREGLPYANDITGIAKVKEIFGIEIDTDD